MGYLYNLYVTLDNSLPEVIKLIHRKILYSFSLEYIFSSKNILQCIFRVNKGAADFTLISTGALPLKTSPPSILIDMLGGVGWRAQKLLTYILLGRSQTTTYCSQSSSYFKYKTYHMYTFMFTGKALCRHIIIRGNPMQTKLTIQIILHIHTLQHIYMYIIEQFSQKHL